MDALREWGRRGGVLIGLVVVLGAVAASAGAQPFPGSGQDEADDDDQTRVHGSVYDSSGQPLARVDVRVFNDQAPANEVRTRTRKTGSYVARGFSRLYTERDVYGIMARVRYEREGYVPTQVVTAVERNNPAELHVVLWREDEDPAGREGRPVLLRGQVTDGADERVRGAIVVVTSPEDGDLRLETETDRRGAFEILVWDGPDSYEVSASDGGSDGRSAVTLAGEPRADLVAQVTVDVRLDG